MERGSNRAREGYFRVAFLGLQRLGFQREEFKRGKEGSVFDGDEEIRNVFLLGKTTRKNLYEAFEILEFFLQPPQLCHSLLESSYLLVELLPLFLEASKPVLQGKECKVQKTKEATCPEEEVHCPVVLDSHRPFSSSIRPNS